MKYTRYADDMLFSSETFDFNKKWFVRKIKYILNSIELKLNYSKLKISNDEISLNGYVISKDGIRLSRSRLSDIRHILSFSERNYNVAKTDNEKFILEANKLQLNTIYVKHALLVAKKMHDEGDCISDDGITIVF